MIRGKRRRPSPPPSEIALTVRSVVVFAQKKRRARQGQKRKPIVSSNSFRSSDLGVMSPARYHCAMLLPFSPLSASLALWFGAKVIPLA